MISMISMDGFFRGLRPENHRFYREKTRAFRRTSWPFTVRFLRATGWGPPVMAMLVEKNHMKSIVHLVRYIYQKP